LLWLSVQEFVSGAATGAVAAFETAEAELLHLQRSLTVKVRIWAGPLAEVFRRAQTPMALSFVVFRCIMLQHMLFYATRLECGSGRARLPRYPVLPAPTARIHHAARLLDLRICSAAAEDCAALLYSASLAAALGSAQAVFACIEGARFDRMCRGLQVAEWPKVGISIDRSRVVAAMDLLLQLATQYVAATSNPRRAAAYVSTALAV
jgi:hypothetical protein